MNKTTKYIVYVAASTSAPVLQHYKPASMIRFLKKYIQNITEFYKGMDELEREYKISSALLYEDTQSYYMLLYDKILVGEVAAKYQNHYLLMAYYSSRPEQIINTLKQRFYLYKKGKQPFPHETGLFMGYPLQDVESYIAKKGKGYLISGYWKVYHNESEAKKVFSFYKQLQKEALQQLETYH